MQASMKLGEAMYKAADRRGARPVRSSVGIPSAPRGVPQIEVTFDIDANGIVNVTAKDKATNKEQQIRIQASGGLSDADINKMVKDAEAHAAEDKKRREAVDAKNHGESLAHDAEKALKEYGDKVAQSDRSAVEAAVAALRASLQGEDVEAIKARTNDLMQAQMKLGEAMYKAQQAAGPGAEAPRRAAARPRTTSSTPSSAKSTTTRRSRPDDLEFARALFPMQAKGRARPRRRRPGGFPRGAALRGSLEAGPRHSRAIDEAAEPIIGGRFGRLQERPGC